MAYHGVNAGDFMLALNILYSGNNFAKIALLMKFIKMKPLTKTLFYQIQALYGIPTINNYFDNLLMGNRDKYKDQGLVLAGKI